MIALLERFVRAIELIALSLESRQEAPDDKKSVKPAKAKPSRGSSKAAPEPEPEPESEPEPAETVITDVQVRAALKNVQKAFGRDRAIKVLTDAGAETVSSLPQKKRAGVIARCADLCA